MTIMDPRSAGLNEDALALLSGRIDADIKKGRYFAASIIVARGGSVGYRQTMGNVSPGRAARDEDVYLLMSVSKSFTAAMILRAIDQGRLELDSRAADILPYFGALGKQRITIRQLLTHTAGTHAAFAPAPPLTMDEMGELEKNVRALAAVPVANIPGERVVYNPFASYAVLGQILVELDPTKRSFRDILREDLFEPLGMKNASYGLAVDDPRRVPVSHPEPTPATVPVAHVLNNAIRSDTEHPAGGAFGTADDVFKFADALRQRGTDGRYRLLSPSLFEYASQNHTGDMGNGAWDFFREGHDLPDFPANFSLLGGYVRGVGHYMSALGQTASPRAFGAVGGGSTLWMVDPERELTFVFLSAGFLDGLDHMLRLQQLSDLALAACD